MIKEEALDWLQSVFEELASQTDSVNDYLEKIDDCSPFLVGFTDLKIGCWNKYHPDNVQA